MSITSTKTNLLHAASKMLLARGLNGFSLQELASSLRIKKSSLFHHYPSKLALAVELYRFYQDAFIDWASDYEKLPPEKQIIKYAEKLTSWICENKRICPVGALSLEWENVDQELQIEIRKLHELQKHWLSKLYKQMDLRIPNSEAVMGTMALLQGSIQLARMTDEPKLVIKNLKSYLKSIKL
jgi:TetR/AcrR family transcriptional regulator, transcriptional repressor for nem operon